MLTAVDPSAFVLEAQEGAAASSVNALPLFECFCRVMRGGELVRTSDSGMFQLGENRRMTL